ncbi:MAG: hypothetical protein JXA15_00450 [Spirochaetales bacterium]|nr:hypothetical protein [Spirochaetales bacterium]
MHRTTSLPREAALLLALACVLSVPPAFAQTRNFEDNRRGVLWLGPAPAIDGDFSDWDGLQGSSTETVVFAGKRTEGEGVGFFVLRSDNEDLYVYADVYDLRPNEVDLPAPIAWRDDSVEIYLGVVTSRHQAFAKDDNHIRIVPVSKDDIFAFDLSVNDVGVAERCEAAVVYREDGYSIEARIPLDLLLIKRFSEGQAIRLEFQVNDAARIERDRLTHWKSPKDDPYSDASVWGDGVVLPLPGDR